MICAAMEELQRAECTVSFGRGCSALSSCPCRLLVYSICHHSNFVLRAGQCSGVPKPGYIPTFIPRRSDIIIKSLKFPLINYILNSTVIIEKAAKKSTYCIIPPQNHANFTTHCKFDLIFQKYIW
jgi:hypothetical protein